ncbi:MAG: MMPL family transporter [Solirubrobacterales bacterium]
MSLEALARWIFRHRKLTVVIWLAVLAASFGLSKAFPGEFKADYTTPGSSSKAAGELIAQEFPGNNGQTIDVVWAPAGSEATAPANIAKVKALAAKLSALHGVGETPPRATWLISPDKSIGTFSIPLTQDGTLFKKAEGDHMMALAEAASVNGFEVDLSAGFFQSAGGPKGPAFLAAMIILLIAFGSVLAAGLPIITALFGLSIGILLTYVLADVVGVPDWAPQVAELLAIGVGIDYALLVLTRFRDALDRTGDVEESLAESLSTAGRSVIVAGSTVVLAVMGLFLVGVEYMRGVALDTSLAVLVVLLTSITLLPALLAMLGHRVNWLKLPFVADAHTRRERENDPDHMPPAARWSRQIQKRPWPFAIVAAVILVALSVPAKDMNLGFPDASTNPPSDMTYKAYKLIEKGFGAGANGPFFVAVHGDDFTEQQTLRAANKVATALDGVSQVTHVTKPQISESGRTAMILVTPQGAPQDPATETLANKLSDTTLPDAVKGTGATVLLGGQTPSFIDQSEYLADRMPVFILGVVLLSLIILLLAFRSPVIAIKAGVMNLLSVGASFGVITLAAQGGSFGQLLGVDHEVPIAPFVPVIMFSILFGLSMDYEVFLMSRVREEYLRGRETHEAVTIGLARTARVITAAAAIMIAVFLSFAFSDLMFLRLMGIGMATAVFLDATLVRMVLVPAILQLMGEANWWIPNWLDRILPHWEIEASDMQPEPQPEQA